MAQYQYAIASGHNVALVSLINPENRDEFMVLGNRLPPTAQPVNPFPVRRVTLSGKEHGSGRVDHVWRWSILPQDAIEYIEDTLFSSGTVVNAACTIYTRKHNRDSYGRYNAYATLWVAGGDYTYDRRMFRDVQLRFRNLVAL